jgi:hypothetical protein
MVADLCHIVFSLRGLLDKNTKIRQSQQFVALLFPRGALGKHNNTSVTTVVISTSTSQCEEKVWQSYNFVVFSVFRLSPVQQIYDMAQICKDDLILYISLVRHYDFQFKGSFILYKHRNKNTEVSIKINVIILYWEMI